MFVFMSVYVYEYEQVSYTARHNTTQHTSPHHTSPHHTSLHYSTLHNTPQCTQLKDTGLTETMVLIAVIYASEYT